MPSGLSTSDSHAVWDRITTAYAGNSRVHFEPLNEPLSRAPARASASR
ncbi:hypothetical protein [Streptomyces sp. 6N223]